MSSKLQGPQGAVLADHRDGHGKAAGRTQGRGKFQLLCVGKSPSLSFFQVLGAITAIIFASKTHESCSMNHYETILQSSAS